MNIKDALIESNFFSIFIFILIISANFLAELFPCRLQYMLRNNMLLKHIFGFFTLIFFVTLSVSSENKNIYNIIKNSFFLYILFILITKSNSSVFYFILIFLGITYIINILKEEEIEKNKNSNKDADKYDYIKIYNNITYFLYILIIILILFGVLIYMGEKKIEYKNTFNYFTFFLGKSSCKGKSPIINLKNALKVHLKY